MLRLPTGQRVVLCVLCCCWLCLWSSHPVCAQGFNQSSSPDTGGGSDREDVEVVREEQKLCVETPEEFAIAFANRESRCVSRNLIGRVFGGSDASSVYLQVNSKPATFYF